MPNFIITDPSGKKFKITAPDGASQDDVLAYAQKQFAAPKPKIDVPPIDTDPTGNFGENVLAGVGRNFNSAIDSGKQIYYGLTGNKEGKAAVDAEIAEHRRLDKPLQDTAGGKVGDVIGDAALLAAPGGGVANLTRKVGGKVLTRALAATAGAAGTNAAYDAAAKPVLDDETRGANAAEGAAYGAGGQVVGSVLSKALGGVVPMVKRAIDPVTGRLKAAYNDATLGQIADKNTVTGKLFNALEESGTSVPVAGGVISNARKKGVDTWRNDVIDSTRPPGQPATSGLTGERIDDLQQGFQSSYDNALAGHTISADPAFPGRVRTHAANPNSGLPPDARRNITENVEEQYADLFRPGAVGPNGPMPPVADAEALKAMESRLGKIARQRGNSQTPDGPAQGELTGLMRDDLRRSYRSQLPQAVEAQLKALDAKYAPFKTVEKASTYVGNQNGEFTPAQLLQAVKARTAPGEFARRGGMLQEEADVGKEVFQNRLANSGTADRTMTALSLLNPGLWLNFAGGAAPVMAGTTKAGRNMMTGMTRAQMLAKKMRLDQMAQDAGAPIGASLEDLME